MVLPITKSARQFGYIIWSGKRDPEMRILLGNRKDVSVILNGFSLGEKPIDWKYYRISLGYKFTRALPPATTHYQLNCKDGILEVNSINEQ